MDNKKLKKISNLEQIMIYTNSVNISNTCIYNANLTKVKLIASEK